MWTVSRCSRLAGVIVLVILIGGGCYPKRVGPPGPNGQQITWPEMTIEQRKSHMGRVVLPTAAAIFGSWRPDHYARVDCTLCHGQGARNDNFSMPNDHLPRLSGDLLLGPEFASQPETTRLKLNRLVPEMSAALGLKSFSIITRKGFGCYSCHLGSDGPVFGN